MEYFDPSFALFDTKTHCATPLPLSHITTDEPFIGSHSGLKCNTSMSPEGDRWRLTGCQLANTLDESTLVQSVLMAHSVFVYCPSFNLTYLGVTVQCGQNVYRLLDNLPWQAGPVEWTFTNKTRFINESFSTDLTAMVNEKLNPDLHRTDTLNSSWQHTPATGQLLWQIAGGNRVTGWASAKNSRHQSSFTTHALLHDA